MLGLHVPHEFRDEIIVRYSAPPRNNSNIMYVHQSPPRRYPFICNKDFSSISHENRQKYIYDNMFYIYNLYIYKYLIQVNYGIMLYKHTPSSTVVMINFFFENGPHILQNPCNHTCNKTVFGIRMMGYCTLDIIIFFSTLVSSKLHRNLRDFNTYYTTKRARKLINSNI